LVLLINMFLKLSTANLGLMSKANPPRFKAGDRVAEKPKPTYIQTKDQATKDRIAQYRVQRLGTVTGYVYKTSRTGTKSPYVQVQWDHLASPCVHAQCRLCFEGELPMVQVTYCESIAP
jgi:hypothetical protein